MLAGLSKNVFAEERLKKGCTVTIHGLVAKPELNGLGTS